MKGVRLEDYVEQHGLSVTAQRLGLTPSAVSQMMTNGREIYVQRASGGKVLGVEIKIVSKPESPTRATEGM